MGVCVCVCGHVCKNIYATVYLYVCVFNIGGAC